MTRGVASITFRILAVVLAMAWAGVAYADKRVALVIGNSQYRSITPLRTPANDSADIAKALQSIGFDVTLKNDVTIGDLPSGLADFSRKSQGADTTLFYYAGHGIQYQGKNYILPVDITVQDADDVEFKAISQDRVLDAMRRAGGGVKIEILDACRDNPLAQQTATRSLNSGGASTRGLARIDRTEGIVTVYSAEAGSTALDGTGRNSPFAKAMLDNIQQPGVEIKTMFQRIAREVYDRTDRQQRPEVDNGLLDDYYLNPGEDDSGAWARIEDSQNPQDFANFVQKFPSSTHRRDAERFEALFQQILQNKALAEQAARDAAAARAAQEEAARQAAAAAAKAAQEEAARQAAAAKAAQEQAAQEAAAAAAKAAQEQAARDAAAKAAQEQAAAAAKAAQEEAARQAAAQAAQEAARQAAAKAAQEQAAREAAAKAAQEDAARQAAAKAAQEEAARQAGAQAAQEAARQAAAKAAQEQAARDAVAKAAQEEAARQAAAKAAQEEAAHQAAAQAAREEAARQAAVKAAQEQAARDAAAKAAQEQAAAAAKAAEEAAARQAAAKAAQEEAARQAAAQAAQEEAARQAAAKAAQEQAARDAAAKAAQEQAAAAAKAAQEEAARQATAKAAQEEAARQVAAQVAQEDAARQAAIKAAQGQAERDAAAKAAQERAAAAAKAAQEQQIVAAATPAPLTEAPSSSVGSNAAPQQVAMVVPTFPGQPASDTPPTQQSQPQQMASLEPGPSDKSSLVCSEQTDAFHAIDLTATDADKKLKVLSPKVQCVSLRSDVDNAIAAFGTRAKAVQSALKDMGCYAGAVDGSFNAATKKAISRYLSLRGTQTADIHVTDDFVSELENKPVPECGKARQPAPVAQEPAPKKKRIVEIPKREEEPAPPRPSHVRTAAERPAQRYEPAPPRAPRALPPAPPVEAKRSGGGGGGGGMGFVGGVGF